MTTVPFADAHVHAAEPGYDRDYPDADSAALLLGCTARRAEWASMSSCGDMRVVRFYGIHPWFAEGWSGDAEGELRSILRDDVRSNVGEIGLDSKRGDVDAQIPAFEAQLSMASDMGRTANIHMVGCEGLVLDSVRSLGGGCRAIILHSFSSESYVKPFTEAGCMFSLNPRIMARSEARVRRLADAVPEDLMLLETDAPYTAGGFTGMGDFASGLAGIMGMGAEELMWTALENARRAVDAGHE